MSDYFTLSLQPEQEQFGGPAQAALPDPPPRAPPPPPQPHGQPILARVGRGRPAARVHDQEVGSVTGLPAYSDTGYSDR